MNRFLLLLLCFAFSLACGPLSGITAAPVADTPTSLPTKASATSSPVPPTATAIPPTATLTATSTLAPPTSTSAPPLKPVRITSHKSSPSSPEELWLEFVIRPQNTLIGSQIENYLSEGILEVVLPNDEKKIFEQMPAPPSEGKEVWLPTGVAIKAQPGDSLLGGSLFQNLTDSPVGPQIRIPLEKLLNGSAKGQYKISWKSGNLLSDRTIFDWDGKVISAVGQEGIGPQILFKDDFSNESSGWETSKDDFSSIAYINDELAIKIANRRRIVGSTPDKTDLSDVRIVVTARSLGKAGNAGFGIVCNFQDEDNYYFLEIDTTGYYTIGKQVNGEVTIMSDPNGYWIYNETLPQNASSYDIRADCGNGKLSLYVNGQEIASVQDSTFTSGDVGVLVTTFEEIGGAEVYFDDFIVTTLE